jgi:hypothetical protein
MLRLVVWEILTGDSQSRGRDLNPIPPEYEAGVLSQGSYLHRTTQHENADTHPCLEWAVYYLYREITCDNFTLNCCESLLTIAFSSMESRPMTVTWKCTTVGLPSFLGGRILS